MRANVSTTAKKRTACEGGSLAESRARTPLACQPIQRLLQFRIEQMGLPGEGKCCVCGFFRAEIARNKPDVVVFLDRGNKDFRQNQTPSHKSCSGIADQGQIAFRIASAYP